MRADFSESYCSAQKVRNWYWESVSYHWLIHLKDILMTFVFFTDFPLSYWVCRHVFKICQRVFLFRRRKIEKRLRVFDGTCRRFVRKMCMSFVKKIAKFCIFFVLSVRFRTKNVRIRTLFKMPKKALLAHYQ